jgi:hypothetical protein
VKLTALTESSDDSQFDPAFIAAIVRLHELTVWGRWLVVTLLWLTVGSWSLWRMRKVWEVSAEYFSWSAIRYGLIFNPWAAVGLGLCIGMTLSVLVWQSRNILWGLPLAEQKELQKRVLKIQQQGASHPLWKWVYGSRSKQNS